MRSFCSAAIESVVVCMSDALDSQSAARRVGPPERAPTATSGSVRGDLRRARASQEVGLATQPVLMASHHERGEPPC